MRMVFTVSMVSLLFKTPTAGWKKSMADFACLTLKTRREKSLLRRHPWVFSGAVSMVAGDPQPGETIDILSSNGQFLARAAYSPQSQIRARVWTFDPDEQVDAAFFRRRLQTAISKRTPLNLAAVSDAWRLVHAESDQIPGLIVDRYGQILVLQFLTTGAEFWRTIITDVLAELTSIQDIYERSDADVRELEGLLPRKGRLRGDPPERLTISELSLRFSVNLAEGHKTGFYLDQRRNRQRVRELAANRDVLDCFCYTGGFSANALAGGARSVLSVDASAEALKILQENIALNELPAEKSTILAGDVFQVLRKLRDEGRGFDLIILDPPKFAHTAAQAEKAARGYKDINLLSFKLLRAGGILVTFSCSGGVDAALFQKIVAGAALDAGADASIVEHLSQDGDHPVSLNFPEGAYLKGLICYKA
jgi:23S rRNA (cytosine1962-C5)-methyltransferase